MARIANQGKTIGDNPPNNLYDKDTSRYNTREYQSLPFM